MFLRFFKVESAVIEMIMIEFSIPDYNETIIKNIFKHWTSWSCVPYAMVHRSVLQWTRGERVPLSLYERPFVAVLHFHFKTAFHRRPKRRRFFPFPNIHRRPSKVFFLFLQRFSSLFFSAFSIRPSIPSLFHCPTGHESRRFQCQSRIKMTFFGCPKQIVTMLSNRHHCVRSGWWLFQGMEKLSIYKLSFWQYWKVSIRRL